MQKRKFEEIVGGLKGLKIGLLLCGNQFIEGILLDVKQDHLVVDIDQKVMYVTLQHIKVLSKNSKDAHIVTVKVPYLNRSSLANVWTALRYTWVTINSLSNEKVFGVLSKISEDYIIVINSGELLYIPQSHISNMYSEITDEQIILLNQMEQLASQKKHISIIPSEIAEINEQQVKQVVIEQPSLMSNNESGKSSENPILEKVTGQGIELQIEYDVAGNLEVNSKSVSSNKPNELGWGGELHIESNQEKVIRGFAPQTSEDIQHNPLQEEQIVIQQLKPINDNPGMALAIENLIGAVRSIASSRQESSEFYAETTDILLLGKQDEYESSSHEERFNLAEYQSRLNEKRILLSEWNTIMTDHHKLLGQNNSEQDDKKEILDHFNVDVESESLVDDSIALKKRRRKKRLKRIKHSLLKTNSIKAVENDFEIVDKKNELAGITADTTRQISREEQQASLKMQYHSLMMHAAGNVVDENPSYLSVRQTNPEGMEEKQYRSLMKYAEKMYHQLRDLR
ncbi:DUF2642 domain-containing protein [Sporosarcina sp. FSL K6-2383]|uniref:DUF2642 domain-containing protein n=1 Tax=Sporosarcina sp. FSL K6-2383 TaxID=2921556 RepID=UPI00315A641F